MPHMSQSPTPPDNSVLTVRTSGTIVTFDMTGILRRVGQYAPTDYKSDNGCDKWSSELVNYSYVLKVDPTKKTTVSAVLTLAGKGYKSTYDVTNSMAATFATSQNYSAQNNEWQFFIGDPAKGSMMIQNMDKTHSLDASIFVNIHRIQ